MKSFLEFDSMTEAIEFLTANGMFFFFEIDSGALGRWRLVGPQEEQSRSEQSYTDGSHI